MAKSYKLKDDNYIDASAINYKKFALNKILALIFLASL